MNIYIFGNGNICFKDYKRYYEEIIIKYLDDDKVFFLICDFRGVDTITMELLKCHAANVNIYHIGDQPRYLPDKYKTKVSSWNIIGGFKDDGARDLAAIENCTHYLAVDFNSNDNRKSGTQKNIEFCDSLGKIKLMHENNFK